MATSAWRAGGTGDRVVVEDAELLHRGAGAAVPDLRADRALLRRRGALRGGPVHNGAIRAAVAAALFGVPDDGVRTGAAVGAHADAPRGGRRMDRRGGDPAGDVDAVATRPVNSRQSALI